MAKPSKTLLTRNTSFHGWFEVRLIVRLDCTDAPVVRKLRVDLVTNPLIEVKCDARIV